MLTLIYTFALGLIVAVFVEMGIYAFFKEPEWKQRIPKDAPSEDEIREIGQQNERYWEQTKRFHVKVSILSMVSSTALLAISLNLPHRFRVLGDGILLGGVFVLLYGAGVGVSGGQRAFRFVIATVSLVVALTLGYMKFV